MPARILRHGVVDSTNERAFAALADGSGRNGDVHVARGQTAGRGRRGNVWTSPTDEGLYLSLIHAPPRVPRMPGLLTMASGLAVVDCARALHVVAVYLKWPNDVLVRRAKLAGILVEARGHDPPGSGIGPRYVIGIGVNVSQTRFPEALVKQRPTTSLLLEGAAIENDTLLALLLERLESRLVAATDDPAAICTDFLTATGLEGGEVRVRVGEAEHVGLFEALTLEEGLVLRRRDGTTKELDPSVVSTVEPTHPFL